MNRDCARSGRLIDNDSQRRLVEMLARCATAGRGSCGRCAAERDLLRELATEPYRAQVPRA